MVFNLKNNRDLVLVLALLFVFNLIEYLLPSRLTSITAYIVGALSFISIVEICQYFIKPYTPKKSRYLTFFIFIIGLSLLFHVSSNFFSKAYIYGTYAGFIMSIALKLFRRKN